MLWQQYNTVSIPLDTARRNYFPHLSMNYFLRSVRAGRIPLRVVTDNCGGRRSKVVYLHDLADYLDKVGAIGES